MADIIKIAVAGAPGSGKSTALELIKTHYESMGITVFCMSDDHIPDIESERKDVLILCECSMPFSLQSVQKNSIVDLWNRYDACLFFETADKDKTQQAQCLDCWVGHPHLRYIKCADKIEDKVSLAVKEIDCILNNVEHEIKYLIKYPDFEKLKKYKSCRVDIEQIYLLSDAGSHRIRRRSIANHDTYFETLKIRIKGDSCFEYENQITAEVYLKLKEKADPKKRPIVKQRYCLLYDGQYFELDVFDFWKDKALIELELSSENHLVKLPPEIELIKDVSTDKRYKNNYLSTIDWNKHEDS